MSDPLELEKSAAPVDRRSMNSGQVESLLRRHFAGPHYAFLTQVRNGTGFSRKTARTADAVAMGTWPSRGIHLHGIEIKVDLQDFKREIANPEKAEDIAKYCHFWWLAVTHEKVAPIEMVPANWGLLIVSEDGTKMRVAKEAAMLSPVAPDHLLIASLMRKMAEEYIHIGSLKDWKAEQRRELETIATRNAQFQCQTAIDGLKKNQALLAKVEKAIGCQIHEWQADEFGDCYKLARELRTRKGPTIHAIEMLLRATDSLRPHFEKVTSTLNQTPPKNETVLP